MLAAVALAACSPAPVVPSSEFPRPVLHVIPVAVGLYMDDAFTTYTHVDKPPEGAEQSVSVGPASRALFSEFLGAQFSSLTLLKQAPDAQPAPPGIDAVLQPLITDVQIARPLTDKDAFHEAWIKYQLILRNPQGQELARWDLAAYGKNRGASFGGSNASFTAAARDAMRDAAAGMALIFRDAAAFQARLATSGTPRGRTP
ncbi:MAG: hypothetical protein ACT4P0_02810 [Panacagrimonas sp.]